MDMIQSFRHPNDSIKPNWNRTIVNTGAEVLKASFFHFESKQAFEKAISHIKTRKTKKNRKCVFSPSFIYEWNNCMTLSNMFIFEFSIVVCFINHCILFIPFSFGCFKFVKWMSFNIKRMQCSIFVTLRMLEKFSPTHLLTRYLCWLLIVNVDFYILFRSSPPRDKNCYLENKGTPQMIRIK